MLQRIKYFCVVFVSLLCIQLQARERFFNLTINEVKIDTVLPHFSYSFYLGSQYADSVYSVSILYPEFIDMTTADIKNYQHLSGASLPELPHPTQRIAVTRKQGKLHIDFCPLVYRNHRYQILVSFMLRVETKPLKKIAQQSFVDTRSIRIKQGNTYAKHSILANGKWAKIRVPATGVYQITNELIHKAGFTDINKVKIYGYGGYLQNEKLVHEELLVTDDLKELPTCWVNGRRLFYAHGSVSWASKQTTQRTRNPYSDYGYYFLTQTDDDAITIDSTAFLSSFYPSNNDYHTLYEVDGYSWYHGGRNLFHPKAIETGTSATYIVPSKQAKGNALMAVSVSAGEPSTVKVMHNGKELGTQYISIGRYDKGNATTAVYNIVHTGKADTVTLTTISGGEARLDYISFTWNNPLPAPQLQSAPFPVPEYVHNITNQDLHGHNFADMIIIIPTSEKLRKQAERLKAFHEQHDKMRVRIVPADELYNEFSSGTPDANAYRRYIKMLYDRAQTEDDMPKYLLLFGDCVWDNRMLTDNCKHLDADDYLLCYESENSFNEVYCYVDDGFFCALDEGEGLNENFSDQQDVAVGRFPVTTDIEAKAMVDKVITYVTNKNAGSWQNTLVFMGDDGDDNLHMRDINATADEISKAHPEYLIKKIMWDAYVRETSSTGNSYPDVSRVIKDQLATGALIMDYGGHGMATQISHERVLTLNDFESLQYPNLPLWVTASCDIMPFDGVTPTIGEAAVCNPKGGAIAFFGTTRTVYAHYNERINTAFLHHVLNKDANGKPITIGEAQRLAKNEMITSEKDLTCNKLQYSLLGDPAIRLHLPTLKVMVDSINGVAITNTSDIKLKAGSIAKIKGHVVGAPNFDGIVTATVRDSKEEITCRANDRANISSPFKYVDRPKILYQGKDKVTNGQFTLTFTIPRDINYSDKEGKINLYAVSNDVQRKANGMTEGFRIGGSAKIKNDSVGPSIYCYLNSPSFINGGKVNSTPYFVAQITDEDGINVSGNSIGHDLQLIIDGEIDKTYNLNNNFVYDFGSYTTGTVHFLLPPLTPGSHRLLFRAWDILNNSSTTELSFDVVKDSKPCLFSIDCTQNPTRSSTTFIINHDRIGNAIDVEIEVFDMAGRILWSHQESGISTNNIYKVRWNLTVADGHRLQTGVYLYRVRISSEGSTKVSKAKKLIVISNN